MVIQRRSNRIVKRWTKAAIECYKIGCNCKLCEIANIIEEKCQMKYIVIKLVEKYGAPNINRKDIL